jgi:beta-glucanase (GH16 family)
VGHCSSLVSLATACCAILAGANARQPTPPSDSGVAATRFLTPRPAGGSRECERDSSDPIRGFAHAKPCNPPVSAGCGRTLAATVLDQYGDPYVATVTWSETGGSITSGGTYTAGANPGTYQVTASGPAGLSATASVVITSPLPPPSSDPQPIGPAGNWNLILADEFNGNELDTSVWTRHLPWWPTPINGELGYYDPTPEKYVEVSNGNLNLTADDVPQNGMPYSTGAVSSHGKFTFRYGTVEMRAKFPAGKGFHIAFWTMLEGGPWPPEIDIVEWLGEDVDLVYHNIHYTDNGHQSDIKWWWGSDFSAAFHTYTMTWKPNRIDWYVDGVLRHSFTEQQFIPQQDMYVLANLAVGGGWPQSPDNSTPFPATWEIDYIRVWQE